MAWAVTVLVGLALFLWLPLYFHVSVRRERVEGQLACRISLAGYLSLLKLRLPLGRRAPKETAVWRRGSSLALWRRLFRYRGWVLSRFTCRSLKILLEIGAGDPAATAWASGAAWGLLSGVYTALKTCVRVAFKAPELQVIPYFSGPYFRLQGDLVVAAPLGHLVCVGLTLMTWLLRELWADKQDRSRPAPLIMRPNSHNGMH